MNTHVVPETAEGLGHTVFHLTAELVRLTNQPDSTPNEVEAARLRLVRMHNEISDALWDNSDIGSYDAGLRSAIATHLNACALGQEQSWMVGPLQPDQAHSLRTSAQEVRAGQGVLGHLEAEVRDAVASLHEARAQLGEALRRSADPAVLLI